LCALLRKWRTDAGLTQRALAKRLRKPPSFVHKTEIGDRRMDPVEFVSWCRACEIEPSKSIMALEK
jgi:predicted transcriptional regulator